MNSSEHYMYKLYTMLDSRKSLLGNIHLNLFNFIFLFLKKINVSQCLEEQYWNFSSTPKIEKKSAINHKHCLPLAITKPITFIEDKDVP